MYCSLFKLYAINLTVQIILNESTQLNTQNPENGKIGSEFTDGLSTHSINYLTA